MGGGVGLGADVITDMINKLVPAVPIADQTALNKQIASQQGLATQYGNQQQASQNSANSQLTNALGGITAGQSAINNAQGTLGLSQNAIGQNQGAINNAQGAVQNAQGVNQGVGSNVNNAIGLIGQTAAGGGAAQQAAKAQLQAGTDQAIATQHALANSGNLSQQIGSQKAAMDNAATLGQQNALNASALQAQMAAGAQGQYAGAAGQQASQAAQNAGLQQAQTTAQMAAGAQQQQQAQLQQAQTAAQQAQTTQQQQLLDQLNSQALGYAGQTNNAQQNAASNQLGGLGIQQNALGQTSQYRAQALGGALNAGGGALALASDKDLKTDIKDGKSTVKSFLDALDSKTFEYKESDNKDGKTPGMHMGVIAQQVEKAPGGKSMIVETEGGKGLDLASAVGTLLAAATESNDRIKELEALYKSRSETKRKK